MESTGRKSLVEPCSTPPRRITIDGFTMNAVVAGSGRTIVFIHGLGWDHTLWGRQIERLSTGYRIIAGDTRGHGGTDKPAGPYFIEQFVSDWIALLDELNAAPALVVGFSLGGMIAQRIALRRPDLVGALVLVNTTCRVPAVGREHMDARLEAMKARGPRAAADVAGRSVFSPAWREAHPERFAEFIDWRAAQDQVALREVMRAVVDFDSTDDLPKVKVPTLVVTARNDELMPPEAQQRIAELIAGAERVTIGESGHMVSIERPEEFDAALDRFLSHHWSA